VPGTRSPRPWTGWSASPQVTARRPGRRVGASLAAGVQARIARLRHLDDTLPGHEPAPVAAAEYGATAALVRDASFSEQTGRSLLTSLGEAGQILGWIEADMGLHQAAQAHYLAGLHAAREAGGAANSVSCLAYMRTSAGSVRDGRLLAAAAIRGAAGRVRPLVADRACPVPARYPAAARRPRLQSRQRPRVRPPADAAVAGRRRGRAGGPPWPAPGQVPHARRRHRRRQGGSALTAPAARHNG
jgi:hypothetical protein